MSWLSSQIPAELQCCPEDVLERYVRARIVALAGSASVCRRLGLRAETVKQAFAESLSEAPLRSLDSGVNGHGPPLQLAFGHDCQSLGCLEPGCSLCVQNPHRRCANSFSTKYLSGDVLKAKCGASIRVQIVDRATLEPVKGEATENIYLEMCILDGKAYAALEEAGREHFEEDVEACIIASNNQGRELLMPGRGATHNEAKWVVVELSRGEAHLPDLTVTGSSEALLSGQKPPFRLLARAMNSSDHTRAASIRFAVSEAFVVATPRVRTAAKAEIPHLDDHVSKLHAVGNMTQNKLQDIHAAAAAAGVYGIHVPYNTVTKVGQFRELVEHAERDAQLCETLKKVLKLTRGWDVARDHALTAVSTDNQMRVWCAAPDRGAGPGSDAGGLLFKCHLGSVDLENPVGLLKRSGDADRQTTLEAVLIQRLPASERETTRRLQKQAAACWWQPGHPGWAIWGVDTQHFLQDVAGPVGMLTPEHLLSSTPIEPHSERPMTRAALHAAQAGEARPTQSTGSASESMLPAHAATYPTRCSTPSEGGASLDGWVGGGGGAGPASRASSVRFPPQPSPQSSPAWAHPPPAYGGPPMHFGQPPPQQQPLLVPQDTRMGRSDAGAAHLHWAEVGGIRQQPPGDAFEHVPRAYAPLLGAGRAPADASIYRTWQAEADSLPGQAAGATLADPWAVTHGSQHAQQAQHAYPGMHGYGEAPLPGIGSHGDPGLHDHLEHMPSSGVVRKREAPAPPVNGGFPTVPLPGGEADPLPSPFGHPEMQNMDVPAVAAPSRLHQAQPMLEARISSGMEPANPKRQHLSPAELQERLSQLIGRPLRAQEMSRLIPNFPDLLEHPTAAPDLPSMTLTTSDLASLMDSMLEPRQPGPRGLTQQGGETPPAQRPATPADGLLNFSSYTYGDLAEAVDMMHAGSRPPHPANAGLDKPRSSSMLMDYMAARLAGSESQLLPQDDRSRGPAALKQSPDLRDDIQDRKSGLETMHSIEEALPKPAARQL